MSIKNKIPKAGLAFIGGSSTFAIDFPVAVNIPKVTVVGKEVFRTPFGNSPEFTLFSVEGVQALSVKMHGWRSGIRRADASKQVFWVLEQAGVKSILAEGGVGSIRKDLVLRNFIVPEDYLDFSLRKDVHLSDDYLLVMRDPVCPALTQILVETTKKMLPKRKISRGVYAVTDGRHFESRAEVRMIRLLGGDVIGQSLCPEVYLAREIRACYAGIYLVVNRAEGIGPDWSHEELKDIFYQEAVNIGKIIIQSLKQIIQLQRKHCQCLELRKKTLLK
jgi:5'-methylthioadenosine phosphorylase